MGELRVERTSYDIFIGNYADLKELLESVKDPNVYLVLWEQSNYHLRTRLNREVARRLQNYVASAKALVEHTRRVVRKKYKGTEFMKEYQQQVDVNFKDSSLAQFVEDLRDYMLHRSSLAAYPTLVRRTEIHELGKSEESYMALSVKSLRKWGDWSKLGREYLHGLDEGANLEEVVDAYRDKVMRFQTWYGPKLGEHHRDDFIEMARLEDLIRDVEPEWMSIYGGVHTLRSDKTKPTGRTAPTNERSPIVSGNPETKQARVDALGPSESRDTEVFTAPADGLVANVVYTPAADIRGSFDSPRILELAVGRWDESESRYLASASANSDDFFLPAGDAQNLPLVFTNRLHVREGDVLYWRSHVLEGYEGTPDPGGTVEVVFEPRTVTAAGPAERDWREYVPNYWIGRTVWVEFFRRPRGEPNTMYTWNHRGEVVGASEQGLLIDVDVPPQLGTARQKAAYPYREIMDVWLV